MKNEVVLAIFVSLLFLPLMLSPIAATSPEATLSVSPFEIVGPPPDVGDTFSVNITITGVTDLQGWAIGVAWNPSVLECLSFTFDHSFFGPAFISALTVEGTINNTLGVIFPPYGFTLTTITGVTGSGTLAKATFRVKAHGFSSIRLNYTYNSYEGPVLLDSYECPIPFNVIDGYFELPFFLIDNVVQSPDEFEVNPNEEVTVTATVTGSADMQTVLLRYSTDNVNFANVTMSPIEGTNSYAGSIPEQSEGTYITYKIFVSDSNGNFVETDLYEYRIDIEPSWEIPEFPTWVLMLLMLSIIIVLSTAISKSNRHRRETDYSHC